MKGARWIGDVMWHCGSCGFVVDVHFDMCADLGYHDVVSFEIDIVSGVEDTDADGKLYDGLC